MNYGNNKTLLIMAAGMGSRYGGLKQIEPMGPNEEFIIDYSIFDAKNNGIDKVVFIIKEENYEDFKQTIGKRVEPHINVEYVFQNYDNVKEEYKDLIKDRTKPLGTAHAILCAKDKINTPFIVINADDYYGQDAFKKATSIMENLKNEKPYEYALINYSVENTMTENGSVKRGICDIENNKLKEITECVIEKENNNIIATPISKGGKRIISKNMSVSMNMIVLTPSIFPFLEEKFNEFLENNIEDLSSCEFFIPDVLFASIKENYADVLVEQTTSKWYGVTYKEDAKTVKEAFKKLHEEKKYPQNLWE